MSGKDRADAAARLAALERITATRRDAALARLSAIDARLRAAVRQRDDIDLSLNREADFAMRSVTVGAFAALDRHLILAQAGKEALEGLIASLRQDREAARMAAAVEHGKAVVMTRLAARRPAQRRNGD